MSKQTNISWTDSTFNPWIGCTKVSAGCAHCYAETLMDSRWGKVRWGRGQHRQRTSAANWRLPHKWNRDAAFHVRCLNCGWSGDQRKPCACSYRFHTKERPRVFCASLADWLDDEAPIDWLADLLQLIHATPDLDWLLLTKRPENFLPRLEAIIDHYGLAQSINDSFCAWLDNWIQQDPPRNVWFGVSAEDQPNADKRIPVLVQIPAAVRFVSAEPLLGPVNFKFPRPVCQCGDYMDGSHDNHTPTLMEQEPGIDWIIFGGESGQGARALDVDWIRDGVRQCKEAHVAAFVKQMGSNVVGREMDKWVCRLNDKKGGDMSEWPEQLRVREMPISVPAQQDFALF